MFQYKVIHKVLPTFSALFRDGIVDHATFNSCNDKEQTLHHLLIDCTGTSRFWTLFKEWWNWKNNRKKIKNLTPRNIYFTVGMKGQSIGAKL